MLPWGHGERNRAERIARAAPGSHVCPPMDLDEVIQLLDRAKGVVGLDSGLTHLGAALSRPTVMLFGPTDPSLTGARGRYVRNLAASLACSPCGSKRCRLAVGPGTSRPASQWAPPCLDALAPGHAWDALVDLMARHGETDTVEQGSRSGDAFAPARPSPTTVDADSPTGVTTDVAPNRKTR